MNDAIKMQISAFVDGELPQNESELLLRRLCQDLELRQQAAEYIAVGRIMRGEHVLVGQAELRERIAAELEDKELEQIVPEAAPARRSLTRPVTGVAIAAGVALVALVGLRQVAEVPDAAAPAAVTAGTVEEGYTVPALADDPLRDYHWSHMESASFVGADVINARLVDLQVREELILNAETAAAEIVEDVVPASESADTPAP